MNQHQADAIANELLAPAEAALEQRRQDSATAAERQRALTIRAWLMLIGFAIGALIAWALHERIAKGGLLGGFAGMAISFLVNAWRREDAAG